jgi:ZIP family zinc transporter
MSEAFFWGLIAATPLVLGALVALTRPPPGQVLGLITGFGAGALLSAVAYELVLEATAKSSDQVWVALGFAAGALTFFLADSLISRKAAQENLSDSEGMAAGVMLGSVLDGVPEAIVLGMSVVGGAGVSIAMLVSIVLSNFPEGMIATDGLAKAGYSRGRILLIWCVIALGSGLVAMIGYALADAAAPGFVAFILAFAGGAVITMVADSMLPEAYKESGLMTGLAVAFGFAVAFFAHALN